MERSWNWKANRYGDKQKQTWGAHSQRDAHGDEGNDDLQAGPWPHQYQRHRGHEQRGGAVKARRARFAQ
jgi:hypothetical protein